MSIINIILLLLAIIGIVGGLLLLFAGVIFIYGWIENWIFRRKIPDKIKKEVEDERLKRETRKEDFRRRYAGTGNPEIERSFEQLRSGNTNQQPEDIQQMDAVRDTEAERSYKPNRRSFKYNPV